MVPKITKMVVRPLDEEIDDPASDGEACGEEDGGPQHALADAHDVDRACLSEAENDGDDHPADRVLADRRGDDDLPEIAAGETHLAHDRRHDLDRGDRQRGAKKQRGE